MTKIPMTISSEAKDEARRLTQACTDGILIREFKVVFWPDSNSAILEPNSALNFKSPKRHILDELVERELLNQKSEGTFQLREELFKAVGADFMIEPQASATIINTFLGGITLGENANFQLAITNNGNITINSEEVADQLIQLLGDTLDEQERLRESIEALKDANTENQTSRVGRVIEELGRCLQHGANATTIIPAIVTIAQALLKL